MDDYIKREDAVKALADMLAFEAEIDYCDTFTSDDFIDDAKCYFNDIPSADVEPVVRCKNCKWMEKNASGDMYCNYRYGGVKPYDFCSYGEKIDEENKDVE